MKKLLTLFTLLLTVCSGAWGETVVWESDMQETITGVTQTKGRASDTWTANTNLTWAPEGTYPSRFNCGGGSSALTLQFNSPLSLYANYAIRVYWGSSKENNYRTLSLTLNSESSACASQINLKNTVRVLEYELTEDVTLNQLKIAVNNDNCYIFKVSIVNLESPETGETTISYNFIKGTNIAEGNSNNRIKNLSNYSSTITTSTLSIGSDNSKDGYSGQITGHAEAFSESSYVALSFKVANGYTFEPSSVGVTVYANSTSNMKTKVEISDGVTTITSNELACSSSADSNVSFAEGAFTNKKLSGTVTIKIYQWGVKSKRAYIKSPVTISGTVVIDSRAEITPSLTYDNTTLILGQTITATPTLTGNTGNGDVTYSSDNTDVATVDENTGVVTAVAVGTAHIIASVAATEDYRAGSAQATIMVATNPLGSHTLTWSIETNTSTLSSTQNSTSIFMPTSNMTGISLVGLTTSDGEKKDLSAKVEAIASYDAAKYAYIRFTVADGYRFTPSSVTAVVQAVGTGKNQNCKMILSDTKNSIESDVTVCPGTNVGTPTDVTISNDGNVSFTGTVTLKIYVYGNDASYRLGPAITISGNVFKVDNVTIAANKEWITYCSTNALDFSKEIEGLEGAYTISSHTSGATTLTATPMTGAVKSGTGLLLHAKTVDPTNPQVISIPVVASGDEQTGNMLKGVIVDTAITPTDGDYTNLGLKNGTFVPYSDAGTIAAKKAYLQILTSDMPTAGAKLTIVFGEKPSSETDGIKAVSTKVENGVRYNLSGQKVGADYKGIVIVNGKKVIIK